MEGDRRNGAASAALIVDDGPVSSQVALRRKARRWYLGALIPACMTTVDVPQVFDDHGSDEDEGMC